MPRISGSQRKFDSEEISHTQEHCSTDTLKITVEATTSFLKPRVPGTPTGNREERSPAHTEAPVPSNLHLWPEQTQGSGSSPTPATHRESLTPTSSDTTGSQELGHTRISGSRGSLTPKSSDTPRISGSQNHRFTESARF